MANELNRARSTHPNKPVLDLPKVTAPLSFNNEADVHCNSNQTSYT